MQTGSHLFANVPIGGFKGPREKKYHVKRCICVQIADSSQWQITALQMNLVGWDAGRQVVVSVVCCGQQ